MIDKPPAVIARYFSFFFCGCTGLLLTIALAGTLSHVRIETMVLAVLFTAYAFMLPVKHKTRPLHILLGLSFFAITIDMAFLLIALPDVLDKFVIGVALFSLCFSYGANVGMELQPREKYRPRTRQQSYEIDYQSLIADLRGNGKLTQAGLHEVTDELIGQISREETQKLFGYGEPNSSANIKWESLAQAVLDIIADGYVLKILELQQSDTQLTKPVMAAADTMMPLWRKHVLKHTKKPSSDFLKEATKQLVGHKVRLEWRKAALASLAAFKRTALAGHEAALLRLGYTIAEFENHYRSEAGRHEIEQIEASIEREFFQLMEMCAKLPLALDGTQARILLTAPRKFRFDSQRVHLACVSTDAAAVIAALKKSGAEAQVLYKEDGATVRRYRLTSEAFTTIDPHIEVYIEDAATGFYTAADMSPDHLFAGFADFYHTSLKGHKIKTVPPSFFIQQILYCWADFPHTREIAWAEDYKILSDKYFAGRPVQQNPLFSYVLNYSEAKDKEATFVYNS